MNAQYLDIVKMFLPEIVIILGALIALGTDLLLPRGNSRRGVVLFGVVVALLATGAAFYQWAQPQAPPAYVQEQAKGMAILLEDPTVYQRETLEAATIRTTVRRYQDQRHALAVQAGAGEAVTQFDALDAGLNSPGFAAWWLFSADPFASIFKALFGLAAALVLLLSTRFPVEKYRAEFAGLLLLSAAGLMIMVSSLDLVVLFLGLEVASVCFYALAAWHKRDAKSSEAGTKYLLLGSLASAFFIFGASLLFVQHGSTHLEVLGALTVGDITVVSVIALLMVLVSFAFKIAAAPFHLWAPDVYEGAPTAVVAFLSTASKAAGFAVLVRVLVGGFLSPSFTEQWLPLLGILAGLSILIGNLVAVHQNNVKRLLAYSGIAQAGYILIGVLAMGLMLVNPTFTNEVNHATMPVQAVIFYLFLYMIANIGAFAITGIVAQESGSEEMRAFAGLRQRAPVLAFGMTILLLSLGGIPLLSGFVGKWFLFLAGVQVQQYLLVVLGAVMSTVSMYYYLLIIKQMYILPAAEGAKPIRVGGLAAIGLIAIVVVTVLLGVYPSPLLDIAHTTARALFGL